MDESNEIPKSYKTYFWENTLGSYNSLKWGSEGELITANFTDDIGPNVFIILKTDPGESRNLAANDTQILDKMISAY